MSDDQNDRKEVRPWDMINGSPRVPEEVIKQVEEMATTRKVTWREAAHMLGVARVAEAHKLRGLYP